MDDRLLNQAPSWTLQSDDDLRRHLEDMRNNLRNTGAKLAVNIDRLQDKLLNIDCGVQQLNTQLALLKNAKFVENNVEDEDSRHKPPPPVVTKTKEEMVQIVVETVKANINKVIGQLECERAPLSIESIPEFNQTNFITCSFIPERYKKKPVKLTLEQNISINPNEAQVSPQLQVIPPPPSPHIPTIEIHKASIHPPNGVVKPIVVNISPESEDEIDRQPTQKSEITTQPLASPIPPAPDMTKFNGQLPSPALPQSTRSRGLFSSDEEDGDEVPIIAAVPQLPIATSIKPKDDLMEQLAARLKNKTVKTEEAISVISGLDPLLAKASDKATIKEEDIPSTSKAPPPVDISRKPFEEPPAATRSIVPAPVAEKPVQKVTEEPSSSKNSTPAVEKQKKIVPDAPKPVRAAQPKKSRGLFSDTDSDEDFFVSKPVQPKPQPVEPPKKGEVQKPALSKTLSTKKKNIFDSDSSDDDTFSTFLKRPAGSLEKRVSSGLVTQRNSRALSPVKAASPKQNNEPTPFKPTVSPAKTVKKEPPVKEKLVTSVAVTQPPAVERQPSPGPSSSSDPLNLIAEEELTQSILAKEPVVATTAKPVANFKQKEVEATVKEAPEPAHQEEKKSITPEPNEEKESPLSVVKQQPPPDLPTPSVVSSEVTDSVPLAPDVRSQTKSPEKETSREDSEQLVQENLPPLPTDDPLVDSPLEPTMPVGKSPGKLNNANFAAMLGSKLSAGPPGMRPSTSPMSTSTSTIEASSPSPVLPSSARTEKPEASTSSTSSTATSPGSLTHLTKSRPRRPGVHRPPTIHKDPENCGNAAVEKVNAGVASMKIFAPPNIGKEAAAAAAKPRPPTSTDGKSPSLVKRTESASKVTNGPVKDDPKAASSGTAKTTEPNISATLPRTAPTRKGLFDFSSSDEEQPSPAKITKAATTLKTSVTSTSTTASGSSKTASATSKTASSSSISSAAKPPASTTTSKTASRGFNKYKNLFNDDDDLDVSLFKKS